MDLFSQSAGNSVNVTILMLPFLLSPLIIVIVIGFVIYKVIPKNKKKRQDTWANLAANNGFTFSPVCPETFLQSGSYSAGTVNNVTEGQLPTTSNPFVFYDQEEVRGGGKNSRTYRRTVLRIKTPDLRAQFVINSKLNNADGTGGNLDVFSRQQRLVVEGNFSDFFDVYAPETEKRDALVLLSPDVLEYLLHNFAAYDIELIDHELFVYSYQAIEPAVAYSLLPLGDELVRKMRLRSGDARPANHEDQAVSMVARTAVDNIEKKYLRKRPVFWGFLTAVLTLTLFILPQDKKPIGYLLFFAITIFGAVRAARKQSRLRRRYESATRQNTRDDK